MRGLGAGGCPMAPPSRPMASALLPCSLTGGPWPTRCGWPQWAGRQTWAPRPPWAAGERGPGWGARPPLGTTGGGCGMEGRWGGRSCPPPPPDTLRFGLKVLVGGPAEVSLPSPPPCLQGDPGKQGDPGRDVSISGECGFGLCSCWGHHTCKGLMPCPMLLGLRQHSRTIPCTQQGVTILVTVPPPRASWGRWVPCHPVLLLSPFPAGAARAAWGAGTTWPRGPPGTARCPRKYQPPCALGMHPGPCPLQSVPAGSVCRGSPHAQLSLPCTLGPQWGLGTPGCWCQGEHRGGVSLTASASSQGKPGDDGKPGLSGKNVSTGSRAWLWGSSRVLRAGDPRTT